MAYTAAQVRNMTTRELDTIVRRYNRRVNEIYNRYPDLPLNKTLKKATRSDVLFDTYKGTRRLVNDREVARRLNQLERLGEPNQQKVTRVGKAYTVKYVETQFKQNVRRENIRRQREIRSKGIQPEQTRVMQESRLMPIKFEKPLSEKDLAYQLRASAGPNRAREEALSKIYKDNWLKSVKRNIPQYFDRIYDKVKNVSGRQLFKWGQTEEDLFIDFIYSYEEATAKGEYILEALEAHGL